MKTDAEIRARVTRIFRTHTEKKGLETSSQLERWRDKEQEGSKESLLCGMKDQQCS